VDGIEQNEQKPRVPRWAAMLAAVALLSPLGFYIAFLRESGGDPTTSFPEAPETGSPDPFDEPASLLSCFPAEDLEPVEASTLDEQIDGVERAVERLRELRSKKRVPITLLSPEDVAERLEGDQLEGLSSGEIDRDTRILEILGVVPEGTNLEELAGKLSGQIVGYYDTDARELFVNAGSAGSKDETLPPVGEVTLAHELEHAIADQSFGLPLRVNAPPSKADAALAGRALVEGDATLLTRHYATSVLSSEQIGDLQSDPATTKARRDAEEIPPAVRSLFEFPYTHGLSFVCDLFGEGGWDAIDRAYERPPSTTAQVMFPARYRAREGAVGIAGFGKLQRPWKRLGGSAVGASDLYALFSAPGGEPSRALDDPTAAAAGWAGGAVEVWSKGDRSVLGMALEEREPEDRLCDSVHAWYSVGFPEGEQIAGGGDEVMVVKAPGRVALLSCRGSEVRLGIGPTLPTARALID
jgi:hypothetical protein